MTDTTKPPETFEDAKTALLEGDVAGWNAWRENSLVVKIDLHGVDLTGADLTGADLGYVDLTGADLTGADLTDANLEHTVLIGAKLVDTKLVRTDLQWSHLERADVSGADITDANMNGGCCPKNIIGIETTTGIPRANGPDTKYIKEKQASAKY